MNKFHSVVVPVTSAADAAVELCSAGEGTVLGHGAGPAPLLVSQRLRDGLPQREFG